MVKFTRRLSFQEQFEALRDFGLGMQTGIGLPGEAAGRLTPPSRWGEPTQAATATGYEISVTSLQLAMAYVAIANGGQLLEPALVSEIRSAEGDVLYRHDTRIIRRVMSPSVAAQMRGMLRDVVEGGSATAARTSLGQLAGKTGTARRVTAGEGYKDGQYTATFAGMFPANDPQFVIVVKLTDPSGMYGGVAAAPVTAAVLKAAAAAQDAALDRGMLVAQNGSASVGVKEAGKGVGDSASITPEVFADEDMAEEELAAARAQEEMRAPPRIIDLRNGVRRAEPPVNARAVPPVRGLSLREAVLVLHRAGFRVKLQAPSNATPPGSTSPGAGSLRKPGELVLLYTNR
jgi:cell division protein FtsI (penicillin-binding protein 3)